MDNRRTFFQLVLRGAAIATFCMFVGAWLTYPVILPVEQLIVASTEDVLRFHTPATIRFYLRNLRLIDPQYRTENGLTLLQFTLSGYRRDAQPEVNKRCLAIADFLIARGVPLDAMDAERGTTALHQAILSGEIDVALFLLEKGADPNLPVKEGKFAGKTPAQLASILLEQGKMNASEVATLGKRLQAPRAP